jgi:hypothetical protein
MEPIITSAVVVAYSQCPRKAYLLLFSSDKGEPHEYVQILEQQRYKNQEHYLARLQQTQADVEPYSPEWIRIPKPLFSPRAAAEPLASARQPRAAHL